MDTTTDISTKKQPSRIDAMNLIRPHIPDLILKALYLAEHGDNDNVKLGAIKLLIGKVIPDVKALELSGDDGKPILLFDVKEYLKHSHPSKSSTKAE